MLVKTHRDGRDHTGLHIGTANVRRYFRKRSPAIDLMLDDLQIQCALSPDFWDGRPEIHDPRLSEWLKFKVDRGRSCREPMLLTMVPSGANTFVVKPKPGPKNEAFGADISPSRKLPSKSFVPLPPLEALESPSAA